MKSSAKHLRDKNSLEAALLNLGDWYKNNRDKFLQGLLVFLIALAVILFVRFYFYGNQTKVRNDLDDAYYIASASSFMSFGAAPDPVPYQQLAAKYQTGDTGALARVALAEACLKAGEMLVTDRIIGSKTEEGSAFAGMDHKVVYENALSPLNEVIDRNMPKDKSLLARACYDAGVACEALAAIANDDAAVDEQLGKAKDYYRKVAESYPNSAYVASAQRRLDELEVPVTVAFYRQSAERFRNLPIPEPAAEDQSILSNDPNAPLDPKSDAGFEILNELPKTDANTTADEADNAPAEQAAPVEQAAAAEQAAPAEKAE